MKGYAQSFLDLYLLDQGMLPRLLIFFAHLLILEDPDHFHNLISSSLCHPGPLHKIVELLQARLIETEVG